ncbi:MAG: Grx4 family monothiol glutaredoxin [Deltaproteobacteria bacterium]|nr:Grx4 family monothiol glutaredoxin [Deltaproteobacteria bacterium]
MNDAAPGLDDNTQNELARLVESNDVLLFMKGNRGAPQCGFSAAVVEILDRYVPDYTTVDVLSNPEIRTGIKKFSDWPTIPQLYVHGEFLGGCDIIKQMDTDGELITALGDAVAKVDPPTVTLTDSAAEVFRQASAEGDRGDELRVTIDSAYRHDLSLGPSQQHDIAVIANGIKLVFDPSSARRASGLVIDYIKEPQEGFKMDNPNAPAQVTQTSPAEIKAWIDAGEAMHFLDVRSPEERNTARIEGTVLLGSDNIDALMQLPKDTKIVFHCHHGMRSYQAAQHFTQQGFRNVHNMVGGIDAWSNEVDASVPKY